MTDSQDEIQTQEQPEDEYITVPKGTTVNKERFERTAKKLEDAEARVATLEEQIKNLQATSDADKSAIEEFKAQVEKGSNEYAQAKADYEKQIAQKDKANELLKAGCIDTESALASMGEEMTIEQLREKKPHLFSAPTKPSGGSAREQGAKSDTLDDKLRSEFGL